MTGVIRRLSGPQAMSRRRIFDVLLMSLYQPRLLCRISLQPHGEWLFVRSSNTSNFHAARLLSSANTPTEEETVYVPALHTESAHHETTAALRKHFRSIPLDHARRPDGNVLGFTRLKVRPTIAGRDPTNFEDCYISDQDHRQFQT
jgi:hypothetical protein